MSYVLAQATATHIPLAGESVQCVVTSPPYWGLRAYAGEQRQVWGGEPEHAHEYVFLLSKSPRYCYDADAIREAHARLWDESNGGSLAGGERLSLAGRNDGGRAALPAPNPAGRNARTVMGR